MMPVIVVPTMPASRSAAADATAFSTVTTTRSGPVVRLLEYHAIAQMRRGPGGGLVVTEPQAQASIDTIAPISDADRARIDIVRLRNSAVQAFCMKTDRPPFDDVRDRKSVV